MLLTLAYWVLHGSLKPSILLHAAAFKSHLQWTAATCLLVKYNITHPLLTYFTIILLNCQSSNDARHPTTSVATAPRKWNVIKVLQPLTLICIAGQRREGFYQSESSRWIVLILICGNVQKSAGKSYARGGSGVAGRTPAWRAHCARAPRRRRCRCPPRAPRAQHVPPPGAAALSSNNSLNHIISTDISSNPLCWCSVLYNSLSRESLLFNWNNHNIILPVN